MVVPARLAGIINTDQKRDSGVIQERGRIESGRVQNDVLIDESREQNHVVGRERREEGFLCGEEARHVAVTCSQANQIQSGACHQLSSNNLQLSCDSEDMETGMGYNREENGQEPSKGGVLWETVLGLSKWASFINSWRPPTGSGPWRGVTRTRGKHRKLRLKVRHPIV